MDAVGLVAGLIVGSAAGPGLSDEDLLDGADSLADRSAAASEAELALSTAAEGFMVEAGSTVEAVFTAAAIAN
jgi:hypothetical protein